MKCMNVKLVGRGSGEGQGREGGDLKFLSIFSQIPHQP